MDAIVFEENELRKKMTERLTEVQERARSRILSGKDIDKVLEVIKAHPHGVIDMDGGMVANSYMNAGKSTKLSAAWCIIHKKKWVRWHIVRDKVKKTAYGLSNVYQESFDKKKAYIAVFPERYKKYQTLTAMHRMKLADIIIPPNLKWCDIVDFQGGLALLDAEVQTKDTHFYTYYLCSPVGYIEIRGGTKDVYKAAKQAGIDLPRLKKDRIWENIEPLWVMAALSK